MMIMNKNYYDKDDDNDDEDDDGDDGDDKDDDDKDDNDGVLSCKYLTRTRMENCNCRRWPSGSKSFFHFINVIIVKMNK